MDYPRLQAEINADPVTLGYSGKTDQQIADLLNSTTTSRTLPQTRVDTTQILGVIQVAAWPTVGSASESQLLAILGMPFVDASNINIRGIFGSIFPNSGGTVTTRNNLLALATRTVSRADELSLGLVLAVDVTRAKAGAW